MNDYFHEFQSQFSIEDNWHDEEDDRNDLDRYIEHLQKLDEELDVLKDKIARLTEMNDKIICQLETLKNLIDDKF